MIDLTMLVDRLGLKNRVEGERVFCDCGHEFLMTEGKWVINGKLYCGKCRRSLFARNEVESYHVGSY